VSSNNSKVTCKICNTEVDVTNIQNGINFDEYYLSCGHIQEIKKQNTKGTLNDKQSTCSICGLTARTISELEEHKSNAHNINNDKQNKKSFEQKIDPFP
jgi:hypothetical protein